jgi:hypothetical protein
VLGDEAIRHSLLGNERTFITRLEVYDIIQTSFVFHDK